MNIFFATDDFRWFFLQFINSEFLHTMICLSKEWNACTRRFIDERVKSGQMMVHDGTNIEYSLIPKPNAIDVDDYPNDVTKKVVDYLRSQSEIQAFLGYN
ncbi:hypothetical protein TrVE_jg3544 [Triparma verrucosa]|uniref:Uncharacterized protein n=1 Tax=Triparma verrucosa TaxID=1606542 RepID=A0A9W7FML7_9STRA|nr:hypothetical protein TrVE_jg3544 [Triparma verrucosa]